MGNVVIKLKNVSKDYNIYKTNLQRIAGIIFGKKAAEVKHALKNVNIEIEEGERVAILSLSESGSTTLLKIISEITYPTKGKVSVNGSINALIGAGAGFDEELTCAENIGLKGIVTGADKKLLAEKKPDILQFAEAETYADIPMKRASKGTNIRMALAIHLLQKDDIFILDDAFAIGGSESRKKCQRAVYDYLDENENITAVIATGRTAFAKRACTRGIILNKGEIFFDGPVEEACDMFKEKFGKSGRAKKKEAQLTEE